MKRIVVLGNPAPVHYESAKLGDELVKKEDQPEIDTETEIAISDDSTMAQAMAEIKTIWSIHSHLEKPSYIASNSAGLLALLGEELGVEDLRGLK